MTSGYEPGEFVGFGDDPDEPRRTGLVRRIADRPGILASLVVLGLAVGGAVWVVGERGADPDPPTVTVADDGAPDDPSGSAEAYPWQAADDGRPDGGVVLRRDLTLTFSASPELERIEVYGLAGPGAERPTRPVQRLTGATRVVSFPLEQEVDCEQVAFPVDPAAYGVDVRVVAAGRSTRSTLDAGAAGRDWASAVQVACASWLARTHVTITSAVVDPHRSRPQAAMEFTLTNDGGTDAYLKQFPPDYADDLDVITTPAGALRIPAHGTAKVRADVGIRSCDGVSDIRTVNDGTGVRLPVTSDVVDLYAMAGPASSLTARQPTWTAGLGPTSVLFAPSAAEAVSTKLREACGGIRGFAVLVADRGARYDPPSRVLTVRLLVDGPPGAVRELRLDARDQDFGRRAFSPLTRRTGWLVPDRTGQVAVTVRYRAPSSDLCPDPDLFLPGFAILARTPAETGSRTVRFTHFAVQWEDAQVRREICPSAAD